MNALLHSLNLTRKSAWETLVMVDGIVRPIAIQMYALLSSEEAVKRYRIAGEIVSRIAEILYLLAIVLLQDAGKRIDTFVSESQAAVPAATPVAETTTTEEDLWISPAAVAAPVAQEQSGPVVLIPSLPLALPAAVTDVEVPTSKRRTSRKATSAKGKQPAATTTAKPPRKRRAIAAGG